MKKSPIVKIAKKICPAVVTIIISKKLPKVDSYYLMPFEDSNVLMPKFKSNKKEMTKIGGGSGFIVSKDGYVLTCSHVVSDPEASYTVILSPDEKYLAKVLARDPINDVAVLKIEQPQKKLPFLKLGDSSQVEIGEEVIAVGNVLGEFYDTVSSGIISGLSRYIQPGNKLSLYSEKLRGLIQTDAAINPGNSGGPLVNMEGKVIGINTATVKGAENIGFSIPINYAKKDLAEVKKYGRILVPFLGIKYLLISKEIAESNKLPVDFGALVVREMLGEPAVIKGSAAEKAGIKEFDIILELNGEKITIENPLSVILKKYKIGEEVEIKILRDKKEVTLKVKLGEKK